MTVFINGSPVTIYRGARVKNVILAFDYRLYKDCIEGRAVVRDPDGFVVGLEGAVHENARLKIEPL